MMIYDSCVPKLQEELPPERVAEIRDVFSMFDKDDSGDIDAVELKACGSLRLAGKSWPNPNS